MSDPVVEGGDDTDNWLRVVILLGVSLIVWWFLF